jgi:hypothetical protein
MGAICGWGKNELEGLVGGKISWKYQFGKVISDQGEKVCLGRT